MAQRSKRSHKPKPRKRSEEGAVEPTRASPEDAEHRSAEPEAADSSDEDLEPYSQANRAWEVNPDDVER
jgi:hypothetical protein